MHAGFEVGTAERELLTEACRTADLVDRLEAAIAGADLLVAGSRGQPAAHPLLRDLATHRHQLARLLAQLGFDAAVSGGEWDGLSSSARARKAANARWRNAT